jgi:hypothetical protein
LLHYKRYIHALTPVVQGEHHQSFDMLEDWEMFIQDSLFAALKPDADEYDSENEY